MKNLIKILIVIILIFVFANFVNIHKDKEIFKVQEQTNILLTELTSNILKIYSQLIFEKKLPESKSVTIKSYNKEQLFAKIEINFKQYRIADYTVSGFVKINFLGFDNSNKPCYEIVYPADFYIIKGSKKFKLFGKQEFCFEKGFYSFNTRDDDLVLLNGQLNVRVGRSNIKVNDRNVKIQNFYPIEGYRTLLSNTLEEKTFEFHNNFIQDLAK